MGRFWAAINTIFYWVTNPLWIRGSLAFIGTEAFSSGIANIDAGSAWDYIFNFVFIWVSISTAIVSLKIGNWIPTLGALTKVATVALFAVKSGAPSASCYLVPIFLVVLVLSAKQITGIGGFLVAVQASYVIYGGAANFMFGVTALLFIFTPINSGSAWMISGDRTLAVAAADGAFFPYF